MILSACLPVNGMTRPDTNSRIIYNRERNWVLQSYGKRRKMNLLLKPGVQLFPRKQLPPSWRGAAGRYRELCTYCNCPGKPSFFKTSNTGLEDHVFESRGSPGGNYHIPKRIVDSWTVNMENVIHSLILHPVQ